IVACGAIGVACGQASRLEPGDGGDVGSDETVEWTLTPNHPAAGADTVAEVTLRDRSRRPIRGASVQIECHMSHPGMAPVIEKAMERSEGVYRAPLQFSMNGDWTVIVKGTLSDGRRFDRRVETATVRQIRCSGC